MSQALTLRAEPIGSFSTTGVQQHPPEEACETARGGPLPESRFPSNEPEGEVVTVDDIGKDWQRAEKQHQMRLFCVSLLFSLTLHAVVLLSVIGIELYFF